LGIAVSPARRYFLERVARNRGIQADLKKTVKDCIVISPLALQHHFSGSKLLLAQLPGGLRRQANG